MSPLALICSTTAAACLTLSGVHGVIWLRDRSSRANLGFSLLAAGVAWFTWAEFALMRALTPAEAGAALQWIHAAILLMVTGVVLFVRFYFRTARPWLGYAAVAVRVVILLVSWSRPVSADYDAISGVVQVAFAGDVVSVVQGRTSIWHWVAQIGFALLVAFLVDASLRLWRSGNAVERHRAATVGGTTAIFVVAAPTWAALIFGGIVQWPHLEFLFFVPMVLAMAYELGDDVLRAARVAGELQVSEAALRQSEQRVTLAADAARLGMWIHEVEAERLWLSGTCRELFGFPRTGNVGYDQFVARVHPDDQPRWNEAVRRAIETGSSYSLEFRTRLPRGEVHWMTSRAVVEVDQGGHVVRMMGACLDMTDQRKAEIAARELSGRLINAQEDERRRIARDLHDDLSQRLALLSVEVDLISRHDPERDSDERLDRIASAVREIASEIHRLAYELHPAKLDQLGLVTATRSWCRDLARQSGLEIDVVARDVPADLPPDVALCLYRIVQESLQNVVRHSGSRTARVHLSGDGDRLGLVVSDQGRGFDGGTDAGDGLGLVSMRERVRLLKGSMVIRSQPGTGTQVDVSIPCTGGVPAEGLERITQ